MASINITNILAKSKEVYVEHTVVQFHHLQLNAI